MTAGRRPRTAAAALLALLLTSACTSGADAPDEAEDAAVVEAAYSGGDDTLVGTRPVTVAVPAGATLRLTNANTGASGTHLLTSARPGSGPSVFTPVAAGALPNSAVWGPCLGGTADAATRSCPVPPVEGPTAWDGQAYLSLGAQLPGETREVTLADQLAEQFSERGLSLWCRIHPGLRVDLRPEAPAAPPPAPAPAPVTPAPAAPAPGRVVAGPADDQAELLAFVPSSTTVPAGGTVTWEVPGVSPHTVEVGLVPELSHTGPVEALPEAPPDGLRAGDTARSGFLSRDPGAPSSTFTLRFLEPGRYRYACRFHPGMTGEVVVTAAG